MSVAYNIQMSFLPRLFPAFPERDEFDLYAAIKPAKEIGGDLYDFFLIDDDHLFFCIGDVSGKGVPAALFMSVTKTLIGAQKGLLDPAQILQKVNSDLCERNEAMLFVTMFCGILNIPTGELLFSNAGHNPPLLLRRDGRAETLTLPEGLASWASCRIPSTKHRASKSSRKICSSPIRMGLPKLLARKRNSIPMKDSFVKFHATRGRLLLKWSSASWRR